MPLGVNAHPGAWLDGVAVAAADLRLQGASAFLTGVSPSGSTGIAARPGVRYGTGDPLKVAASSGMNITVNAGVAWVQGTASATAGMYTCCLDTAATLTVATSDPTNPRIDNVIAQITDVGSSSSTTVVTLQTGTPAASPVAPTLPANSLLLAQIAVAASTSSITAGNITDKRVWTAASGGITPMANVSGGISGMAGQYVHDLSTGRLKVSDGGGNAIAPKTGAFAPVFSSYLNGTISSTSYATMASVSVTVDGFTEIAVLASWGGINMSSPVVGSQLLMTFLIDGIATFSNVIYYRQDSTSTVAGGGGFLLQHVTPAAGAHTLALAGKAGAGGLTFGYTAAQIVVRPAFV